MKQTIKKKIVLVYRKNIKENYKTGDWIQFTLFLGIQQNLFKHELENQNESGNPQKYTMHVDSESIYTEGSRQKRNKIITRLFGQK